MNKIKMLVAGAAVAIAATFGLSLPVAATVACPAGTLRGDSGGSADSLAQCSVPEDEDGHDLLSTVQTILNVAISVLGIVTVVMIILGAVQYTISQGDPGKITKARNTILYGVIGLVIALLAFAIVNFVLKSVFNPEGDSGSSSTTQTSSSSSSSSSSASTDPNKSATIKQN